MTTVTAKKPRRGRVAASAQPAKRLKVVMIRKSGSQQDEKGQADNVAKMLEEQGIKIDEKYWFYCTVPRAFVEGNADFKRLMELVQTSKVGTIYVETQDRFGTDDVADFFAMIKLLRSHRTRLFDLREKMDLTQKDDRTLMMIFMAAMKSSKERKDIGFRTTRKKVPLFMETGSWPSGKHPFGFGKRCYDSDGKTLLWEWQPSSRTKGQIFYPDGRKLKAGPKNVSIPKKESGKRWVTKLVPSNNNAYVKTVQLIFDLFVSKGLSYRKISLWLNDHGREFYDVPFTFGLVREILKNPAYVGDTHYGKTKSARHYTFDTDGNTVEVEGDDGEDFDEVMIPSGKKPPAERRPLDEQLIKRGTHKGLITQQVWKDAQQKIADMNKRPSFTPRKSEYYLKPILVCGHCGKNMTGGMEGKRPNQFVTYFCSTYKSGKSNGQESKCAAYRITHAHAEKLILDKIKEAKLEYDQFTSAFRAGEFDHATGSAEVDYDRASEKERGLIQEGILALRRYYDENYSNSKKQREKFYEFTRFQYGLRGLKFPDTKEFRHIVAKAESEAVEIAKKKLQALEQKHGGLTSAFTDPKATAMMKEKIASEAEVIEREIPVWKERIRPMSARIKDARQLTRASAERFSKLEDEWSVLEMREKGEALRRIFKSVTLYWEKQFHPSEDNPRRKRRTNRQGRYSYKLLTDKIGWEFSASNLDGSR
jgi:hypothetical protein